MPSSCPANSSTSSIYGHWYTLIFLSSDPMYRYSRLIYIVRIHPPNPSIILIGSNFYHKSINYLWCLRVKILQIIDQDFVLDITKNKLLVLVVEACDRMLVELDALDDGVGLCVYLVENVPIHNCLNAQITPDSQWMHRTWCLVNGYIVSSLEIPCSDSCIMRDTH